LIAEDNAQIICFSLGGGPLPILGNPSRKPIVDSMLQLPSQRRPNAVLVISARWEESSAILLGDHRPPMFYDYYIFLLQHMKSVTQHREAVTFRMGLPTFDKEATRLIQSMNWEVERV